LLTNRNTGAYSSAAAQRFEMPVGSRSQPTPVAVVWHRQCDVSVENTI
jgi:hypothetical protein